MFFRISKLGSSLSGSVVKLHFGYSVLILDTDRVRLAEWMRQLNKLVNKGDATTANQYAQLLRIQLRVGSLCPPFLSLPPTNIQPLTASLGQELFTQSPTLPTPGPLAPFMCRKSQDGHAYVAVRQIPGKGVLCYLAVSTSPMEES